jgi:hypothetical protein
MNVIGVGGIFILTPNFSLLQKNTSNMYQINIVQSIILYYNLIFLLNMQIFEYLVVPIEYIDGPLG